MNATRDTTAAIIVIGNEILSGKVVDTNSAYLAAELRGLGVALQRIVVIPDEVAVIANTVRDCHSAHDLVFTSGGVGPTHDDVTIAGVAQGLGRAVVRNPMLEQQLRELFGDKINEARLKLCETPEGAELVFGGHANFPALRCENVYILPGIPELLRDKFEAIKQRFATAPYHLRVVYTRTYESTIAASLTQTLAAFPELQLGSYPKLNHPEYQVRVTLESKDRDYVDRALDHLMKLLPPEAVVRTE
ncbi:MAG: competence/damage-inducible protein A [Deltaproteobacteria bacterium]|nr:competence/damage-inducible protein A [Deltaproteobacteria bacterium]